jgi:hypothetical protein
MAPAMTPLVAAKNVLRVEESGSEFDMGPSTWSAGCEFCEDLKIFCKNSKPPFQAALNSWVELLKRQAGGGHYCMRTLTAFLIFCCRSAIEQKY